MPEIVLHFYIVLSCHFHVVLTLSIARRFSQTWIVGMWVRYISLEEISGIEGPNEMSGMLTKYVCTVVFERDSFFTIICVLWHAIAPHNFKLVADLYGGITHWGRDKMIAILLIFSNAFSFVKIYQFRLKYHRSLLLKAQLIIFQHWFTQWLGAD